MEGSLRNADILAVIDAKVPARLEEIEKEREKLSTQLTELGIEKEKLMRVQQALTA